MKGVLKETVGSNEEQQQHKHRERKTTVNKGKHRKKKGVKKREQRHPDQCGGNRCLDLQTPLKALQTAPVLRKAQENSKTKEGK
jgi:hypothetical protein